MNIVKKIKFLIVGLIVFSIGKIVAHAGLDSGADFLKIPIGAHSVGLGQATTAGLTGVEALNWNPAAIDIYPTQNNSKLLGLSFSHQQLFTDNYLDQFGVTVPLTHTTVGINLLRVSYVEQEQRGQDRRVSGHFTPIDTSMGLSVATQWQGIHVGSQMKWISQKLATDQAQSMALDLGFLSPTPLRQLTIGATMKNFGQQMKFVSESYDLPLTFSIGGLYKLSSPLSIALDVVNRPYQNQTSFAFGAELNTTSIITLRAGYLAKLAESIRNTQKSETNRGNVAGIGGLSAGMGIRLNQFRLDYAFAPYGELGTNQIITLSTYFSGASISKQSGKNSLKKQAGENSNPQKYIEKSPAKDHRQIIIFDSKSESFYSMPSDSLPQ